MDCELYVQSGRIHRFTGTWAYQRGAKYSGNKPRTEWRRRLARRLAIEGLSRAEISAVLDVHPMSVNKYLDGMMPATYAKRNSRTDEAAMRNERSDPQT